MGNLLFSEIIMFVFNPLQTVYYIHEEYDLTGTFELLSQFNPPTFPELLIGLHEVAMALQHYMLQLLVTYGDSIQFLYGTLTNMEHEERLTYCSEMPAFPSEEWRAYVQNHFAKALLCSDKVTEVIEWVEAIRLAVPAVAWTFISFIENYLEPEANFDLNDHLNQ